jgi:hypothetical protein
MVSKNARIVERATHIEVGGVCGALTQNPRQEPYAVIPHIRICAGVAGGCHSYRDQLISRPAVMKRGSMKTAHRVLSGSTLSQPGSLIISGNAGKNGLRNFPLEKERSLPKSRF